MKSTLPIPNAIFLILRLETTLQSDVVLALFKDFLVEVKAWQFVWNMWPMLSLYFRNDMSSMSTIPKCNVHPQGMLHKDLFQLLVLELEYVGIMSSALESAHYIPGPHSN
ncbi:hypothetical protein GOP47_0006997 [Adiantum capillus-veneris]|uniref:Uncharacterized protein n=1 Tax=Adiantum capillus-veneris TaxID=13818 RepID=A0A9D4V024_ADICA|nr:hypothetical protein GOP47_0006997 [Adiantum capillus-veneris]